MNYHRKETYSIEAVLPFVPEKRRTGKPRKTQREYDGDIINMASTRFILFKEKGVTCIECGVVGSFFAKERQRKRNAYHFNLYALKPDGIEVLMTKDHIIPKCLNGSDTQNNYQPMCIECNQIKGERENPHNEPQYRRRILRIEAKLKQEQRFADAGWVWLFRSWKFGSFLKRKYKVLLEQ